MSRQIILDTETTGLETKDGHRVIEVGGVEMVDRRFTGNQIHFYINPEREVEQGALEVHGITNAFLRDKPVFSDLLPEIMTFLDGAQLVIHNAPFDIGFLDHELRLAKHAKWRGPITKYCSVFDTLTMARKMHPGQRNSLDALCKRYDINNKHRQLHGALLDAQILANLYLAMTGGQEALVLDDHNGQDEEKSVQTKQVDQVDLSSLDLVVQQASHSELKSHQEYMKLLSKQADHVVEW